MASWNRWEQFMKLRGAKAILEGETKAEKKADEDHLLAFVRHYGVTLNRSHATVRQRMYGIRCVQMAHGVPDPLVGKHRLKMAIKGLSRTQGTGKARKLPTTTGMLRWMHATLRPELSANGAIMWFAVLMAFMFLMRAKEYAFSAGWDHKKVMTPACIRLYADGQITDRFADADELHYCWPASKTDQEGARARTFATGARPYVCFTQGNWSSAV